MRLTIGHRLFISVLLAMLAVAASAVLLLRQQVLSSFSEYAVRIELERLEELAGELGQRHAASGSWRFLPTSPAAQQRWIAQEMARLQARRGLPQPPAPPMPPPPPPPLPGAAAVPPLPPPDVAPAPNAAANAASADLLQLQDRVTLLDSAGGYLAGRRFNAADTTVRRPVSAGGATVGFLVVTRAALPSDTMASAFLQQLKDSLWIIVAASVVMSAIAAVLLASHFRQPIRRLAEGARQLAEGRYETRLAVSRSDELGALAASFNQLAEKLDRAEASRRQWVADTSHELRTPLAVLRAQLEAMQDGVRAPSPDNIAAMLRQVLALNKLIDQLYLLARADVGELDCQRVSVDLCALAREQANAFSERFNAAGISVSAESDAACMVKADPDQLRQVLTNVFENAIRYCGPGTRVAISARLAHGVAELVVDDSGPGVPDDALPHLADRFYRVDASRSREHGGAGLGLALSQRIAAAHGGQLLFARSPLGGLQVRLTLAAA